LRVCWRWLRSYRPSSLCFGGSGSFTAYEQVTARVGITRLPDNEARERSKCPLPAVGGGGPNSRGVGAGTRVSKFGIRNSRRWFSSPRQPRAQAQDHHARTIAQSAIAIRPQAIALSKGCVRRVGYSAVASDELSWERERTGMAFAIKAEVCNPRAKTLAFTAQKTMYGGRHIAGGDTVFLADWQRLDHRFHERRGGRYVADVPSSAAPDP
jgi:hypothetical protein